MDPEREKRFMDEALRIIKLGEERGFVFRLMGAVAVKLHCPKYVHLYQQMKRTLTDIDYATYSQHRNKVGGFFKELGYAPNEQVIAFYGKHRHIYWSDKNQWQVDLFFDELDMCHKVDFRGRLELDSPTITLADIVLEKMQIVRINEKDVKDTIILLLEHDIGDTDNDEVNGAYIAGLLSRDWGYCHTVTTNLKKIRDFVDQYEALSQEETQRVKERVDKLLGRIKSAKKGLKWKLRAKLGTKVKWYKEVEEVSPDTAETAAAKEDGRTKTRFMFATDLHGSETVWRKFLNSAKMFQCDALVMSGDMTGKVMVPRVQQEDGTYHANLLNENYTLKDEDIEEFQKKCRMLCYIPYVTTPEEAAKIGGDEKYREDLFERLEGEIVEYWLSLIPDRVPEHVRIVISPGNDDKHSIDEVIKRNPRVIFGEEEVVALDDEHEVLCCGWSNPTPFDSPRECSEEELEQRLEAVAAKVKDMSRCVFCIHVPPHDSQLDMAPLTDKDLKVVSKGGRPQMVPVGSTAVRKFIEKHQPLLGIHGHIHESPGFVHIGKTECLNPGSEYGEGVFKGYLVEIEGDKITKLQRVEA
jgi:Icc-related predicted phosphoesterase